MAEEETYPSTEAWPLSDANQVEAATQMRDAMPYEDAMQMRNAEPNEAPMLLRAAEPYEDVMPLREEEQLAADAPLMYAANGMMPQEEGKTDAEWLAVAEVSFGEKHIYGGQNCLQICKDKTNDRWKARAATRKNKANVKFTSTILCSTEQDDVNTKKANDARDDKIYNALVAGRQNGTYNASCGNNKTAQACYIGMVQSDDA